VLVEPAVLDGEKGLDQARRHLRGKEDLAFAVAQHRQRCAVPRAQGRRLGPVTLVLIDRRKRRQPRVEVAENAEPGEDHQPDPAEPTECVELQQPVQKVPIRWVDHLHPVERRHGIR
jgi:hypothetical protein